MVYIIVVHLCFMAVAGQTPSAIPSGSGIPLLVLCTAG